MQPACLSLTIIFSVALLMVTPSSASPVSEARGEVKRSLPDLPPSPHMQLADRILKRVLDVTYETLQDLGASREDLERVQEKRNYIQACYFQAISCY